MDVQSNADTTTFFQLAILERRCLIIDETIAIERRLVNFADLFMKASQTGRCGVEKDVNLGSS